MNKEKLSNQEVIEFLRDVAMKSTAELLENGSKEKNELFEIAAARGITLKNNKDLAGVKFIYAFTDTPNENGAVLLTKEILKVLPTMVGKPLSIDHERSRVCGAILDYRWIPKEKKIISYAVVYKSNFAAEWQKMQKLFKAGQLCTSFEIWSDAKKREYNEDGSYILKDMTIAGAAILLKTDPAFPGAKVLSIAKYQSCHQPDLVFASQYKDEDILTAEGPSIPQEAPKPVEKIKCANCGKEITKPLAPIDEIKCTECFAIINMSGDVLYPPQIIDFNVSCLGCGSRNWRVIKKDDVAAEVKCLNCAKRYDIEFKKDTVDHAASMLNFVHLGQIACKQCGATIEYSGTSKLQIFDLKCPKCGLQFKHDIMQSSTKKIKTITETKIKADLAQSAATQDAKGEHKMAEIEKEVKPVEATPKAEVEVAEAKTEEVTEQPIEAKQEVPVVEETPAEVTVKTEVKPEEATVEPVVEAEATPEAPEVAKVEETPADVTPEVTEEPVQEVAAEVKPEVPVEEPVEVSAEPEKPAEAEVKAEPEQPVVAEPKVEEVPDEAREGQGKGKARQGDGGTDACVCPKCGTIKKHVKGEPCTANACPKCGGAMVGKKLSEAQRDKFKLKAKAFAKKIKALKKETASLEDRVEFYKANAEEISKRRTELGDTAVDLSDIDILDADKFSTAKVEKANKEIAAATVVGEKTRGSDYYQKLKSEIDEKAFGPK